MKRKNSKFTVRMLIVVTTIACVVLSWVGNHLRGARNQREAVLQLRSYTGFAYHGQPTINAPQWLYNSLGIDFFQAVVDVDIAHADASTDVGGPNHSQIVEAISQLSALRSLRLRGNQLNDATLQRVGKLRCLQTIDVPQLSASGRSPPSAPEITDVGIEQLANLRSLREFNVTSGKLTDRSLEVLGRLRRLERLTLASTGSLLAADDFTDEGIHHLRFLSQLRELSIRSPNFSDPALGTLGQLTALETLSFHGNAFTDKGFACLGQLQSLERLVLRSMQLKITDASIDTVLNLPKLESLRIDCKFTDQGLKRLADVRDVLRTLSISPVDSTAAVVRSRFEYSEYAN